MPTSRARWDPAIRWRLHSARPASTCFRNTTSIAQAGEPYPLLLVRPEGIAAYYAARAAMKSWGFDFGYELIDDDWKLSYPPPDSRLADLLRQVVAAAPRDQARLIAAAPREYRQPSKRCLSSVAKPRRIRRGNRLAGSDDPGYRSQSSAGPVGQEFGGDGDGSGKGAGGPAWLADPAMAVDPMWVTPLHGQRSLRCQSVRVTPVRLVLYTAAAPLPLVEMMLSAVRTRAAPTMQMAAIAAVRVAAASATLAAAAWLRWQQCAVPRVAPKAAPPTHMRSQAQPATAALAQGGGSPNTGVFRRRAGVSQRQRRSLHRRPLKTEPMQQPRPMVPRPTAAAAPKSPARATVGGQAPARTPKVSGRALRLSGGTASDPKSSSTARAIETPDGYVVGQPPHEPVAANTSQPPSEDARPGRALRPGEWEPSPDPPPKEPKKPDDEKDKDKDLDRFGRKREKSPIDKRGEDWGLRNAANGSAGVTRPIRVECYHDRLVVVSERGPIYNGQVAIGPRMASSIDPFISAIWEHMDAWGIAGRGMYWRPVLEIKVAPDAEQRFSDLNALLTGSGLTVVRE